jgi:hypothetical protein
MRDPLSLRVNSLAKLASQGFGGLDGLVKLLGRRLDGFWRLCQHDASAEKQRKGRSQGEVAASGPRSDPAPIQGSDVAGWFWSLRHRFSLT